MTFLDGHLSITVFWPLYILHATLYGHPGRTPGYCAIFSLSIYTSSILMWPSEMDNWALWYFSHSMYVIHIYVVFLDGHLGTAWFFPQYGLHLYLCGLLGWTTGYHDIFLTVCTPSVFMWPSGMDNWVLWHFFPQYVPHPYLYGLLGRTTGYYDIFSHSMYLIHIYVAFWDGQLGTMTFFPTVCTSSTLIWPSWMDNWYYDIFSHSIFLIHTCVAFLDGQLCTKTFFPQYVLHPHLSGLLGWTTGYYVIFSHGMYPVYTYTYVAFLDGHPDIAKFFVSTQLSVQEGHIGMNGVHTVGKMS